MKFLMLILKNVRRNLLRTILTAAGTMVLVFVVTLVWSVLDFLDQATSEKAQNLKTIVTERWQIPSRLPFSYAQTLSEGAPRNPGDIRVAPPDSMTWQFYGGTLDPQNRTPENNLFAIAMEPEKLMTMMDDLDSLPPDKAAAFSQVVEKLKTNKQGLVLGKERLRTINKQVGDRIKIYSINYREIDLEFEIVGLFPDGRYDLSAAFNRQYLNDAMDQYPSTHGGKPHPMMSGSLNLVWLRVPDRDSFQKVREQIEESPFYSNPAVKCETAASGVSTFMEAYRDLIFGMRYLLAPAIIIVLSLVIANAISISVRERRTELAVLKVLGFRPSQILVLVIGEALMLGGLSGLVSAGLTYWVINRVFGGLNFPIAFFSTFMIPDNAVWWGLGVGAMASLAGSIGPALSARSVKVSEVFSKVA
ncbi:MAG: ABC transporter permease [Pirellulales bacterium]